MNDQMLAPNVVIGEKFKVIRKVGGGSFGSIFLAMDTTTKELVAIKIVIPLYRRTRKLKSHNSKTNIGFYAILREAVFTLTRGYHQRILFL